MPPSQTLCPGIECPPQRTAIDEVLRARVTRWPRPRPAGDRGAQRSAPGGGRASRSRSRGRRRSPSSRARPGPVLAYDRSDCIHYRHEPPPGTRLRPARAAAPRSCSRPRCGPPRTAGAEVELVRLEELRIPSGPDAPEPDDAWWFWERLVECDALIVSTPIISRTVAGAAQAARRPPARAERRRRDHRGARRGSAGGRRAGACRSGSTSACSSRASPGSSRSAGR